MRNLTIVVAMLIAAGCGSGGGKSKGESPDPSGTLCGNGFVDEGEACDPAAAASTCEDAGATGGEVLCKADCSAFDLSSCGAPETCGNGSVEAPEVCDGEATTSCGELGLGTGEVTCEANCLGHDTSACVPDCEGDDCECVPDCSGRVCGVDPVCGTSCGTCEDGTCNEDGICELEPRTSFGAAMEWSVPSGGQHLSGFDALGGEPGGSDYAAEGSEGWSTIDLTGDGLPDLVVTRVATAREGYYWWGEVLGYGASPHWDVYENTGSGFAGSPTTWTVPTGGKHLAGFDNLAGEPGGSDYDAVGSEAWVTTDLTGDGRPDLVVVAEAVEREGYYYWKQSPGYPSSQHWLVYENTGSGFAASATTWALPSGGKHLSGFAALSGDPGGSDYDAVGNDGWSTVDMTGDGLPDLVVTMTASEREGYYWWGQVLGYGASPHWLVYPNTGSGFADSPITWSVPDGGQYLAGFKTLAGEPGSSEYEAVGHEAWVTMDVTGDGLPDLVVTADAVEREGYYYWKEVPGYGGSPHWRVHENTGSGFAATPTTWSVPDGGKYLAGFNAVGGEPGNSEYEAVGHDAWSVTDVTGDGLPDLVVTAIAVEREGYYYWNEVLDHGASPHWNVFVNQGDGFAASPSAWSVPAGGQHLSGFDALAGEAGSSDYDVVGSQSWATLDVTGDGALDLVVTAVAIEREGYYWWAEVMGYGASAHWTVYPAVP